MKVICPKCHRDIPGDQLNVAANVARCVGCNEVFPLAALVDGSEQALAEIDLNRPPSGVFYLPRTNGMELSVSTRTGFAWFFVPFTLLWGGGSLAGIYGSQLYEGRFDLTRSLFGIPFLLGTVALTIGTLLTTIGRTTVRVEGDDGSVSTGFGPFRYRRRFDFGSVTAITQQRSGIESNNRSLFEVVIQGPRPVKFGAMLREERRSFVVVALRQLLRDRSRRR